MLLAHLSQISDTAYHQFAKFTGLATPNINESPLRDSLCQNLRHKTVRWVLNPTDKSFDRPKIQRSILVEQSIRQFRSNVQHNLSRCKISHIWLDSNSE